MPTPLATPGDEPQIVLIWLSRLRWLAVAGQVLAVLTAVVWLKLSPPMLPVSLLIGLTAVTNVAVGRWATSGRPPRWLVFALLMLDVLTLTGLLACTGGSENPFKVLYLVHVAMAVVTLPVRFTWVIVVTSVIGYGVLLAAYVPLVRPDTRVNTRVLAVGEWLAVTLVAVLIAYFIGRLVKALRDRERELALTREIAARNEQLAGLTTLAAGAAHELGTPLGTIALVAKELERHAEGIGDDDVTSDARLIRQECDRCRHILDRMRVDIREDGIAGTAGVSKVDAPTFIDRVRGDLEADEQPRVDVDLPPDLQAEIRPARAIQQAVGVLLSNALEASGVRGRVLLTLHRGDNRLKIIVSDRGAGMDEATLRRAGQPFFTTKGPGVGMGLGLFLVRLVAERSGGSLTLESTLGEGTVATLDLPAETADNHRPKPPGTGKRKNDHDATHVSIG